MNFIQRANADSSSVIFTDSYKTKELLWNYYSGFVENFGIYTQYLSFKRHNQLFFSGAVRYAYLFYGESKSFYSSTQGLDVLVVSRVESIFEKGVFSISRDDLFFLRDFFQDFMVKSGIKNIVFKVDTKSGLARSQEF